MFVICLEELKAEDAGITTRMLEIETELSAGNTESVCYDTVRETLARFNEMLGAAPPDQKKTLLQLIIREIHLTPDRKIDRIEISFDESVQTHFIAGAPSVPRPPRKREWLNSHWSSDENGALRSAAKRHVLLR